MANATTIIADLNTVIANGPQAATTANAINPAGVTVAAGGAGNFTGGTGAYGAGKGPFYGGIMDYPGNVKLVLLKAQEIAVLLARIVADTDQATDGTNQGLLINILNDFQ